MLILIEMYEKTTCQFQIKFIANYYLQMYKTLQLITNIFTSNANTLIKVIKTHMYRHNNY